jgi:predicted metal-dependent peptidase
MNDLVLFENKKDIHVVVAFDTSGSIDLKEVEKFLNLTVSNLIDKNDFCMQIIQFDCRVDENNIVKITPNNISDISKIKYRGGGDTMFSSVYQFLEKENIVPDYLLIFSDGYAADWIETTKYSEYCKTIFVIHGSEINSTPFGQVLKLA